MLEGRWEPWVEPVLEASLTPGMRFADIGANFGYYTLLGAQWVYPGGEVFSFEANPEICKKLRKSVTINGFNDMVSVFEVGVSDGEDVMELTFSHEYSGGGHLGASGHGHHAERAQVRTARLDTLLADVPSVDVMKLDVEGMEPAALRGASALIARSPELTVILEFSQPRLASEPGGALGYLEGFAAQGFSIAVIEPQGVTTWLEPGACLERMGTQLGHLLLRRN
jgi:FkbM family methyltransferase